MPQEHEHRTLVRDFMWSMTAYLCSFAKYADTMHWNIDS